MNKKQLTEAVKESPKGIESLYDRNWNRITQMREWEQLRAFTLMRWALCAFRPLTVADRVPTGIQHGKTARFWHATSTDCRWRTREGGTASLYDVSMPDSTRVV